MNCLFTVVKKGSMEWNKEIRDYCSKSVKVYDIRIDKAGFPHFLIHEDNQWKYKSAKFYEPIIN